MIVPFTDPRSSGWSPQQMVTELLDARQARVQQSDNGPWILILPAIWSVWLRLPYWTPAKTIEQAIEQDEMNMGTLGEKLMMIEKIDAIAFTTHVGGWDGVFARPVNAVMACEPIEEGKQ